MDNSNAFFSIIAFCLLLITFFQQVFIRKLKGRMSNVESVLFQAFMILHEMNDELESLKPKDETPKKETLND